ncbi:UNVERIFIED_CONTAM: hypothetical protein Cloal_2115 [Acetivibrio alkalicellulosi]
MKKIVIFVVLIATVAVLAYIYMYTSLSVRLPKEDNVYGGRIKDMHTEKTITINADDAKNILSIVKKKNRLELFPVLSSFSFKITLTGISDNDLIDIYITRSFLLDSREISEKDDYRVKISNNQYIVNKELFFYLQHIKEQFQNY